MTEPDNPTAALTEALEVLDDDVVGSAVKELGGEALAEVAQDLIPYLRLFGIAVKHRSAWNRLLASLHLIRQSRIVIMGASGVGKTSILQMLRGQSPVVHGRTEQTQNISAQLRDSPLLISDTPGEEGIGARADRRDLFTTIRSEGAPVGIVLVAANGYSELDIVPTTAFSGDVPNEAHLEQNRSIEMEVCAEIQDELVDHDLISWLVVVANKADLWFQPLSYQKIISHYKCEIRARLPRLAARVRVPVHVQTFSTHNELWYGKGTMTGSYGDRRRAADYGALIARLVTLTQ